MNLDNVANDALSGVIRRTCTQAFLLFTKTAVNILAYHPTTCWIVHG